MTSKRKRERDNEPERYAKRQRRRKRSRSVPLMHEPISTEKRQALKRLFGRYCSVGMGIENENIPADLFDNTSESDFQYAYGDENDDPLLDSVPVDMDPEQLGFLVCAQETLRFLHCRGVAEHPMFSRLRTRLLRGIQEMAMA